jgi:hypothetical protein
MSTFSICIRSSQTHGLELRSSQSFHWFANKESLKEIHRILAPHGHLGMVWNIDDYNSTKDFKPQTQWERKLHDLIWSFDDDLPRYRHNQWRQVFDEQVEKGPLSLLTAGDQLFTLPLGEQHEHFETKLSKDQVWERYNTLSHIAQQEGEERDRTYKTFTDAINSADVEIDDSGKVAVHGTTIAVWTAKIPNRAEDI